jgi:hypothetical protein
MVQGLANFTNSRILETPVEGKYKWIYGMIVIDPTASALSTKRNQHQLEQVTRFTGMLQSFNENGFLKNDVSSQSMVLALKTETSIL